MNALGEIFRKCLKHTAFPSVVAAGVAIGLTVNPDAYRLLAALIDFCITGDFKYAGSGD